MYFIDGKFIMDSFSEKDVNKAQMRIRSAVLDEKYPCVDVDIMPVVLITDDVFSSYEEAEKYLQTHRKSWVGKYNAAVAFYFQFPSMPQKKKYLVEYAEPHNM